MIRRLLLIFLACFICFKVFQTNKYTVITFCDVGEGDALLIQHNSFQILIDTGRNESVINCLTHYLPFYDRAIEVVIATHSDSDHIGGLQAVLKNYSVEYFYHNFSLDESTTGQEIASLLNSLQQVTIEKQANEFASIIMSDSIKLTFLNGQKYPENLKKNQSENQLSASQIIDPEAASQDNSQSLVSLLEVGNKTFLFTADMGESEELALIKKGLIRDIDVLKVAHHGSKYSNSEAFLDFFNPEVAIVSSGANNNYGHPHSEVLSRLDQRGIEVRRTDTSGTIAIFTDGMTYWTEVQ